MQVERITTVVKRVGRIIVLLPMVRSPEGPKLICEPDTVMLSERLDNELPPMRKTPDSAILIGAVTAI